MKVELIFSINILLGLVILYIVYNSHFNFKTLKNYFRIIGYLNLIWGILGCILLILGYK